MRKSWLLSCLLVAFGVFVAAGVPMLLALADPAPAAEVDAGVAPQVLPSLALAALPPPVATSVAAVATAGKACEAPAGKPAPQWLTILNTALAAVGTTIASILAGLQAR